MPILNVEIVGQEQAGLAQPIAEVASRILGSRPRGTWVKVRFLPESAYAENSGAAEGMRPVFVSVLEGIETVEKAQIARELAFAISAVVKSPTENVHILFEAPAKGRIAFGGNLFT